MNEIKENGACERAETDRNEADLGYFYGFGHGRYLEALAELPAFSPGARSSHPSMRRTGRDISMRRSCCSGVTAWPVTDISTVRVSWKDSVCERVSLGNGATRSVIWTVGCKH